MNDHRPTRWPCSADSSRKAGPAPRRLRKADTGVSQSSTRVSHTGTRLYARASARTSSSVVSGAAAWAIAGSAAPAVVEHARGVGQGEAARAQQHREVVEDVGGLLGDPVVALLARRAGDFLGLLLDLLADARRVAQQRSGVGALGPLRGAGGEDA